MPAKGSREKDRRAPGLAALKRGVRRSVGIVSTSATGLQEAVADPEVAAVLPDMGLNDGDGPGLDDILGSILRAREEGMLVLAHVCGTGNDLERLAALDARLRGAGITLALSNGAAARLAGMVLAGL